MVNKFLPKSKAPQTVHFLFRLCEDIANKYKRWTENQKFDLFFFIFFYIFKNWLSGYQPDAS